MRTAFLALMLAMADGSANAADAGFHAIALPHRRKGLSPAASIADAVAQSTARAGVALRGAVQRAAVAIAGRVSDRADHAEADRVSRRWWGCAAVLALVASPATAQTIPGVLIAQFNAQSGGTAKPSPGQLFSTAVTPATGQGGGFMMLFDAVTPPADGAVTPAACFYVPTGPASTSFAMGNYPGSANYGISWAFSTGANCQTKTAAVVSFVTIVYK